MPGRLYHIISNKYDQIIFTFASIEETAKAADFFRADGLIVTGSATGDPASPQEVMMMIMMMMVILMMMVMMMMMTMNKEN